MQIYGEMERIQMTSPMGGMSTLEQSSSMKGPTPGGMAPMDQVEISPEGKMMTYMSGLTDEEKTDIVDYLNEVKEALETGTYDAEEMTTTAPEALTAFAEENGLDLEDMITSLAQNSPPPREPEEQQRFATKSDAFNYFSTMKFQYLYQRQSASL